MLNLYGYGNQLVDGIWVTLEVAFTSLGIGLALGLIGAAAKLSPRRWLSMPATAVTNILRGVPEFVILLICYFGLSNLMHAAGSTIDVTPFEGGVFALSIVFGSYASEAFRGAFLSVGKGQLEAARAFGMRPLQVFIRIHLPQAWRLALPSLNNQWQNLLKDTSLVSVLGLEELMRKTQVAAQVTKEPFVFYITASMIYLVFLAISNPIFILLERRASRGFPKG